MYFKYHVALLHFLDCVQCVVVNKWRDKERTIAPIILVYIIFKTQILSAFFLII